MARDIVTERVIKSQENTMPCLLCFYPTMDRGIHVPKKPYSLNKTRVTIYAICKSCINEITPEKSKEIESLILQRFN